MNHKNLGGSQGGHDLDVGLPLFDDWMVAQVGVHWRRTLLSRYHGILRLPKKKKRGI